MTCRVLHIIGDSKFGGGSVIVLRLAEAAMEAGLKVDVLTTDSTFQKVLREHGIGMVPLDCIWREIRPIRDLYGLWRLYHFLRCSEYEIVHTHTSKAGFVGRAAAWWARVPVVIHTVHGFAFHEESSPCAVKVYSTLEHLAARWCLRIISVSEYHRNWALKLGIGDAQKVIAIPNGISPERVKPTRSRNIVRAELGINEDEVVLISVGRLAPQKGLEYLLQAVPLMCAQGYSHFRVVLVGDGPMRADLEALARKLGIKNHIMFLEFRRDIGDLLGASDIVVMPSLWEGLSIALLEAMAAGKPIVTTTIGSNLEVTDHGRVALLVPPKDPEAIAQAVVQLMRDPDKALSLARAARERFLSHYTEERMLAEYINLYLSLIKERGLG